MTTKPELLKWVPGDEAAKITDPGTTKRAAGWLYKEKPAFQFLNWLFNIISKWQKGLQGGFYDIIIGSAAQVTANEATHDITDLDDTLAVAGSRVLILDGTHTLTGNLSLSNDDLKITSESPLAILDVATYTATFSGARDFILLRVTNSGAGDIIVSGAGAIFEGIDVPIVNVVVSNGAVAKTSGTAGGVKYPNVLQSKTLEIGDWDMDAVAGTISIAHGSSVDKIRSVDVVIREDANLSGYMASYSDVSVDGLVNLEVDWDGTNVKLERRTGGKFDSAQFDATSYNRGWVTVWYID